MRTYFGVVAVVLATTLCTPVAEAVTPAEVVAIEPGDSDERILEKAGSVTPSPRQREWQRMELTSFHHFGVNTFTGREWGSGTEDPDVFNPSDLDTDQWMRSLRDAGFKQAILTVKHHDGFLLYPTRYSNHSVKHSSWQDGKGDVFRSFVDSARRHGLKVGFYLSPADLHEAQPGGRFGNGSQSVRTVIPERGLDGTRPSGPRFTVTANDYNRFYLNTLYELMTQYGKIDEVWWDGADAVGGNKERFVYAEWVRLVRGLQPDAVIFQDGGPDVRWVGNEHGYGRQSEHSVLPFNGSAAGAEDRLLKPDNNSATDLGSDSLITQRHGDGKPRWDYLKWLPAECDTPLGQGWFWDEGDHPKSFHEVQNIYLGSVGRNCQLLLNIAPDNTGRFTDADLDRLREFTEWRTRVFGTDYASDAQQYWNNNELVVNLSSAKEIGIIGLQEDLGVGQRVTSFALDAWDGSDWVQIADATTIGYKRLIELQRPVTTDWLRLRVTSSRGAPAISAFTAHPPR